MNFSHIKSILVVSFFIILSLLSFSGNIHAHKISKDLDGYHYSYNITFINKTGMTLDIKFITYDHFSDVLVNKKNAFELPPGEMNGTLQWNTKNVTDFQLARFTINRAYTYNQYYLMTFTNEKGNYRNENLFANDTKHDFQQRFWCTSQTVGDRVYFTITNTPYGGTHSNSLNTSPLNFK